MSWAPLTALTGRASVLKLWTLELSCQDSSPSTPIVTLKKSLYRAVVSITHLLGGGGGGGVCDISGTALFLWVRIKLVNICPALRLESGAE